MEEQADIFVREANLNLLEEIVDKDIRLDVLSASEMPESTLATGLGKKLPSNKYYN